MASLCHMARKKKLIAAAALATSPRRPPPAIRHSTDGPAQQLRKLNRFLVTETVELRKQVNALKAKLASMESGSLISIPASASVPPPAEENLDAEQVAAAEKPAAPVSMEALPAEQLKSVDTVVPLHPEGRRKEKFQGMEERFLKLEDEAILLARKKKLIAAAALASSRRLPPPAIDLSTDGPAQQLRKMNRFLVTEKLELRKQVNLLRDKLISIESASVPRPAEANLDAEQVTAAERTSAPVNMEALPIEELKSVDTAEPLENAKKLGSEHSEISSCAGVAREDCTVAPLHPEERFQKLEDEVFLLKKRVGEKNCLAAELSGEKTKSKWIKWIIPATILLAAAAVAYVAKS